jgi:hypothetical protein
MNAFLRGLADDTQSARDSRQLNERFAAIHRKRLQEEQNEEEE